MKRTCWILAPSLAAVALVQAVLMTGSAHARQSGEVVQATPSAAAVDSLNRNLASLSRNPQDVTALLGAGQAALDLGDVQAANGFFTRANMVNPQLGKAKLGLAVVQIALRQPGSAAENFDAAQALGEQPTGRLSDRGMAYDLTGQQDKAQRDYLAALRTNASDAPARLRYAVSLGISGKVSDADRQLEQALAAGDREAWRMRAFIYAMNGRMADARKVTQSVMPKGLADALDPYMQRLPLLTPGQKASAAYYGEFPANVLRLAAPEAVREVQVAAVAPDTGKRNRRPSAAERREAEARQTREAQARETEARRLREAQSRAASARPATPPPATTLASAAPIRAASPPPVPARQDAVQPAQSPFRDSTPAPQQSFEAPATVSLAASNVEPAAPRQAQLQGPIDPGAIMASAPTPRPAQVTAPASVQSVPSTASPGFSAAAQPIAPSLPSLADALSALSIPEGERRSAAVSADFSAVARIQQQRRKAAEVSAAKVKADAEAKAKAEAAKKAEAERKAKLAANPSRSWVQVATGRDVDALAFDLRRLRRSYAEAIGDQPGWTVEWGATRRLLIGPFKKVEDARAIVTKITKSGGDAFVWQSEAGEEVAKIGK